jgi:hypothetical protein
MSHVPFSLEGRLIGFGADHRAALIEGRPEAAQRLHVDAVLGVIGPADQHPPHWECHPMGGRNIVRCGGPGDRQH